MVLPVSCSHTLKSLFTYCQHKAFSPEWRNPMFWHPEVSSRLIWVFKSKIYQETILWEYPAWIQTPRTFYKSGGHCNCIANNNYPPSFWALTAWRQIWSFQLTIEELRPQRFRAITKESERKKSLALILILNRRFSHTVRPFMWTPEQSMLSLPWRRRLDL